MHSCDVVERILDLEIQIWGKKTKPNMVSAFFEGCCMTVGKFPTFSKL